MTRFDRFADAVAKMVAQAWFFMFCIMTVVIWGPSIVFVKKIDTWQLIINTATTIITFLLVALLHNTQHRFENADNLRWQAFFKYFGLEDPVKDPGQKVDKVEADPE